MNSKTIVYSVRPDPTVDESKQKEFEDKVISVLIDSRGWVKYGYKFIPISRYDSVNVLAISLVSKEKINRLFPGIKNMSCYHKPSNMIFINEFCWDTGGKSDLPLDRYRNYVINHEVGHALGLGHSKCHDGGKPGSIMMQMTRGPDHVSPCVSNDWPLSKDEFDEFAESNPRIPPIPMLQFERDRKLNDHGFIMGILLSFDIKIIISILIIILLIIFLPKFIRDVRSGQS